MFSLFNYFKNKRVKPPPKSSSEPSAIKALPKNDFSSDLDSDRFVVGVEPFCQYQVFPQSKVIGSDSVVVYSFLLDYLPDVPIKGNYLRLSEMIKTSKKRYEKEVKEYECTVGGDTQKDQKPRPHKPGVELHGLN